jgi:hypothetical protein
MNCNEIDDDDDDDDNPLGNIMAFNNGIAATLGMDAFHWKSLQIC